MQNDLLIQHRVRRILLQEPIFQEPNMIYQFVWRFWEECEGKEFSALSKEGFISLNIRFGTVESIIRARRKVLKKIGNKDLGRYKMAQRHYLAYLSS